MDQTSLMIFYIASSLYTLLLCTAAAFDTWKFIIPNAITVGLIALFVVTALLLPYDMSWRDWMSHLGAAGAVLAGGAVMFAFNKMGGGDVKLMTAVAFWAGFEHLANLLLYIAVAGGALAIALMIGRRLLFGVMTAASLTKIAVPRVLLSGEPVPYGLAIAPSAIFIGTRLPQLGVEFWL
ncbi:MAG: A24 family peptidase [Alphaproteobacteria bacterium]